MTNLAQKNLLILQTGAGAGHLSITQAIEQGLEEEKAAIGVSTANILPKQFEDLYAIAQKPQFIDFYHLFFKLTDNPYGSQVSAQINLLFQKGYFTNLIKQYEPSAILSNTQFGVQEIPPILEKLHRETGRRIPFYVFIPDPFTPHHLCFSEKADLTFVPTIRTYHLALRHKLEPGRIVLSGHPIRQEFYERPADIEQHRLGLGLEPGLFTILFGASGDGSEQTLNVISRLSQKMTAPFQALVVTGRNRQLRARLAQMNFPDRVRLKLFGFISDAREFANLFHAADLVAAKAGPNAILEAVAAGKPFIATHYIKGQESGNKNYLISTGVGLFESKPKRIAALIGQVSESPALLEHIKLRLELERSKHREARSIIARQIIAHLERQGG